MPTLLKHKKNCSGGETSDATKDKKHYVLLLFVFPKRFGRLRFNDLIQNLLFWRSGRLHGDLKPSQKVGGEAPSFWMVLKPLGAAQTPKMKFFNQITNISPEPQSVSRRITEPETIAAW
jgi:hypothetical protein